MVKSINLRANIALGLLFAFLANIVGPCPVYAQTEGFILPAPGQMVALSHSFSPAVLKGIKLDAKNPFRFHFFVDRGMSNLSQEELKSESAKLIKYFLASLTIPEKDLWVNLSPYEKDRIVPQEFGQTEMGRDLLAEDYLLKQITASLIYPESQLGKEFWAKVYAQAQIKFGTTNIPVNTFNKVWIVPEKAVVYENGGVAFVLENHLKVMLEQDYLSLAKHEVIQSGVVPAKDTNQLGSQIVREIVIPALTKEVNEGKNFSQLRQVFYSLILATWYKKKIKDSILNRVYSNRNKIGGVNVSAQDKDKIYQLYIKAFKKGVYNYIKEDLDQITGQTMPRKYFSGGVPLFEIGHILQIGDDKAMLGHIIHEKNLFIEDVRLDALMSVYGKKDQAMNTTVNGKWPTIKRIEFALLRAENAVNDFLKEHKIMKKARSCSVYNIARKIMDYEDTYNNGFPIKELMDPFRLKELVKESEYGLVKDSKEPDEKQKQWILQATKMVKAMCQELGVAYEDFLGYVRVKKFPRKQNGEAILGQISLSGIIFVDDSHQKGQFIEILIHEAMHFLSKGFNQSFLNEGMTQYLTLLTLKEHNGFFDEQFDPNLKVGFTIGEANLPEDEIGEFKKRRVGPASGYVINQWLKNAGGAYLIEVSIIEAAVC